MMYTDLYRVPPTDSALALLDKAQALREERDRLAALLRRFVNGINDEWCPMFSPLSPLSDAERQLLEEAKAALSGMDAT